ncbi:MAG: MBG domain-containing protein, partial [Bacteroidota bacterium]
VTNYSTSPQALEADGWRLLASLGNAQLGTSYLYHYSEADLGKTFEWSVQAVDNSYTGGAFSTEASFEILPPALTLSGSFEIANKVYDGSTTATVSTNALTLNGVLSGANDVTIQTVIFSFADKQVGVGKEVSITSVTLGGTDASSYTVDLTGAPTASADVTPADLVLSGLASEDKVYDGTTVATLTGTPSISPLGSDVVTVSGTAEGVFAQANVGIAISVSVSGLSLLGADQGNYTLVIPNLSADITQASLSIAVAANQEKVFGTTDPTLSYTATGFATGDDVSLLTGSLARTAGENVGTYAINQGSLSAGDNYTINFTGAEFTISEKTLTITADAGQNKVYGDADPTLSYTATGFENGNDESILIGTLARVAGENIGNYAITLNNLSAGNNYTINYTGADFEITPASLTITADAGQSKVYGEADPTFTYTASGFENGDGESILTGTLLRAAGENVGTYAINQGSLSAGDNYSITYNGADFEITPASLTITADAGQSKVYGDSDPTFTYTVTGFEGADDESILTGTLARSAGENIGTYAITQGSLSAGDNYMIDYTGADFEITAKTLMVIADAGQSKVYGDSDPTFTFTVTGFEGADDESILTGALAREAGENVGNYLINLGNLSTGDNYTIDFTGADFAITEATLTITVHTNQSKVYGEADPTFTYTATGFANGDDESILTGTLARASGENVGNYVINLGSVSAGDNYTINFVGADFSIISKDLTITAEDQSKVYGQTNPVLTFTYTGLVNGDTQVTTEPSISTTAVQSSNVGTYPITLEGGSDDNYTITLVNGTLTVSKKAVTITADDKSKTYGEENPALTFTYTGLTNGDTKVATEPSISTTATQS